MDCPFCGSEALTCQFAQKPTSMVKLAKEASDTIVHPVTERLPKPLIDCIIEGK